MHTVCKRVSNSLRWPHAGPEVIERLRFGEKDLADGAGWVYTGDDRHRPGADPTVLAVHFEPSLEAGAPFFMIVFGLGL